MNPPVPERKVGVELPRQEAGSLETTETRIGQEEEPASSVERSGAEVAPQLPQIPAVSDALSTVADPVLTNVENILADGLMDVYGKLPSDKQVAFKKKGEEVAKGIRVMIAKGKLKLYEVVRLIRDWLRMIPGVNVFFLEQEAKIKADRINAYAKEAEAQIHNDL